VKVSYVDFDAACSDGDLSVDFRCVKLGVAGHRWDVDGCRKDKEATTFLRRLGAQVAAEFVWSWTFGQSIPAFVRRRHIASLETGLRCAAQRVKLSGTSLILASRQ